MSKKARTTGYVPAEYRDDPDAIATVSVYDPDRNAVIPIEIGYYYHSSAGSTIYLMNDVRSKQLLSEATAIDLVKFSRSRPSKAPSKRAPEPAQSYRPAVHASSPK